MKVKNNNYVIVSMYTSGSIYEKIIKNLRVSLEKFNLEYDFTCIEDQGSWEKNCQQKVYK